MSDTELQLAAFPEDVYPTRLQPKVQKFLQELWDETTEEERAAIQRFGKFQIGPYTAELTCQLPGGTSCLIKIQHTDARKIKDVNNKLVELFGE